MSFWVRLQALTEQSADDESKKLSSRLQDRSCIKSWWPLKTIFNSPLSMSKTFINVLDVYIVQAAAKYFPLLENLILKDPNASVSNFHIFKSGSSDGKSLNFSHLFNNYFFYIVSVSPSFLAEGLEIVLSIASNEIKPTSFSHGALEKCFLGISTSDLGVKPISTSKNEG